VIRSLLLLSLLPAFAAPAAVVPAPVHCQIPCGIYGDSMRIDMLMEDAATIEKSMTTLIEMAKKEGSDGNQLVRWVVNKDEHAGRIQETVASYWLAQRIKVPAKDDDDAALAKYHRQLALLHGITVAAMKCKQTTDRTNVKKLRDLAMEFSGTYFKDGDLEHIRAHHQGEHR